MLRTVILALLLSNALGGLFGKPLDIVFLLDVGEPMRDSAEFVVAGARLAAFELRNNDRVAIVSYSSGAKVRTGLTNDTSRMERAFQSCIRTRTTGIGQSKLHDALLKSIGEFKEKLAPDRNRVIAVITNDSGDDRDGMARDLIAKAKDKGVAIWFFLIASPFSEPGGQGWRLSRIPYPDVHAAAQRLTPLASETGGTVSVKDPNGYVLRQIVEVCRGKE
jgi:uncharacterized protein (DUF58 family)